MSKKSYVLRFCVSVVLAIGAFTIWAMKARIEEQSTTISRLCGNANSTSEVSFFGSIHPTIITLDGFDGEVIWIKNQLPSETVRQGEGQNFIEVGKTSIGSFWGPHTVGVPLNAEGYIVRSFGNPYNQ